MDETEAARLVALRRYEVLDTAPEEAFDRAVRLAQSIFRVPIALISFVDAERQWFKAKAGLDIDETPRAVAFCNYAIRSRDICEVQDATRDPLFAANPLVTGAPGIRFYAGAPLITPDGHALGTLCVLDVAPRPALTAAERAFLEDIAATVMSELELRRQLLSQRTLTRRTNLRVDLVNAIAEAPDFNRAAQASMRLLREATRASLCLFWRLGADHRSLSLIAGQLAPDIPDEESFISSLRALDINVDTAPVGRAILDDRQLVISPVGARELEAYPVVTLSHRRGVVALIVTPISLGSERLGFVVGFDRLLDKENDHALLLAEAAVAMRPLLRRWRDNEQTELLRRVIEASSDAVMVCGADLQDSSDPRILYVNEALIRLTAYTREELLGKSPRLLQGPLTDARAKMTIREAIVARKSVTQEILNYRKDATSYWAELRIAPISDPSGDLTHWVSIQRDITERRSEAKTLAENEALFRQLFEQHPSPMWVYDQESLSFLEVNRAAIETYGWSRDEFLRMTILDIRPAEQREVVRATVRNRTHDRLVTGPWTHRTASGEERRVQILSHTMAFRGHNGVLVVVWDVTDRLRAEAEAQALAHRLELTFESIRDGVYTLSRDWNITYVNAQAERMLQRSRSSIIGRSLWAEFPGATESELYPYFHEAMTSGATQRFETFYVPLNSWVDVSAYPSADGITVFIRDITERRRREERLRLLETAVSRSNDLVTISRVEADDPLDVRWVYVNDTFTRWTGYTAQEAIGKSPRLLHGPLTDEQTLATLRSTLVNWNSGRAELVYYRKSGEPFWIDIQIAPIADDTGTFTHWIAIGRDITERKQREALQTAEAAVLGAISAGLSIETMAQRTMDVVGYVMPQARSAIMLADATGESLYHCASLKLTEDFRHAIDGVPVREGAGVCGSAAFRCAPVISRDALNDPLCAPYAELLRRHGIASAWSVPIIGSSGTALGTFVVYHTDSSEPGEDDLALLGRLAELLSLAFERARKSEALVESEQNFRQLAETIDEVFWIASPDHAQVFYVSPAYQRVWGFEPDELYRNPRQWFDSLLDEDKILINFDPSTIGSNPSGIEYRIRRSDGVVRWILDRSFPLYSESGDLVRVVGLAKDITDHKADELRVRESEERFRLVAMATNDVIWDWDLVRSTTWWNDGLFHRFGYRPEEVQPGPESWTARIHPDDVARVEREIHQVIESTESQWAAEYRFIKADGTIAQVVDRGFVMRDKDRRATRMVGSMIDVTAERRLEEQVRQSQRLDAIGQLTGGVAHDFNNLLTVILGNADFLVEALGSHSENRKMAETMRKAAERGASLTNRLLSFARRQPLAPQTIDVNQLIDSMDDLLRRTLGAHIDIKVAKRDDLWPALADPSQLENAVLNLCVNARDAMPEGGRLTIETTNFDSDLGNATHVDDMVPGQYVMIAVSDTGIGMDTETMVRAFEPFFTTKEVGQGSGLGLSMVYGFAKQSRGQVKLYSEKGIGTTIKIYLPRADVALSVVASPERKPKMSFRGRGRILVVEDDALVREYTTVQLERLGYEVVAVESGPEALRLLESDRNFDLLLTDIVMPGGMNGHQLVQAIRRTGLDLPTLYTSGYAEHAIVHAGRLEPGAELLSKPYRGEELAQKVSKMLDSR